MLLPVLAALAVSWLVVLVATPMMPAAAGAFVYVVTSLVCHQLPERSFHIAGNQLPVCARCLGVYGGAAAIAVLGCVDVARAGVSRRSARLLRRVAVLAAAPTLLTVVAEWAGLWATSNSVRAAAGAGLGAGLALVIVGAVAAPARSAGKRDWQ